MRSTVAQTSTAGLPRSRCDYPALHFERAPAGRQVQEAANNVALSKTAAVGLPQTAVHLAALQVPVRVAVLVVPDLDAGFDNASWLSLPILYLVMCPRRTLDEAKLSELSCANARKAVCCLLLHCRNMDVSCVTEAYQEATQAMTACTDQGYQAYAWRTGACSSALRVPQPSLTWPVAPRCSILTS